MKLTKNMVDELHALKVAMDNAAAEYEAAIKRVRDAGVGVYKGNDAALIVEELTRRTVDNKAIFAAYNVPEKVIKEHTKSTTYTRAVFKAVA